MKKIDILMATYNGEKYVAEQIESILNQTYTNFNLIISDDCSTDSTREILEEYKQKDSRIEVYYQEQNLGYVKNFEFLLTKVESEVYMLSDQDDVWLKEKVEKTYNKLVQEKADLVYTDLKVVDENLQEINPSFMRMMKFYRKATKYKDYRVAYLYNTATGCTIISKKKFLDKVLPVPKNKKYLIHDSWIMLVVSMLGKTVYMDEAYILYRQHGNNQVGAKKTTSQMKNLDEVRKFVINIKKDLFEVYCDRKEIFKEELQTFNKQALDYFNMVERKKNINFRGWNTFHKIYKTEGVKTYILTFLVMNVPILARGLYKIKNVGTSIVRP